VDLAKDRAMTIVMQWHDWLGLFGQYLMLSLL
jgi:chromate transporter